MPQCFSLENAKGQSSVYFYCEHVQSTILGGLASLLFASCASLMPLWVSVSLIVKWIHSPILPAPRDS